MNYLTENGHTPKVTKEVNIGIYVKIFLIFTKTTKCA